MTQLRIAETQKYAHVTFFFNGGEEKQYEGEDRILVASPKISTFDLMPEMSAPEVSEKLNAAVRSGKYDAIIVNFANCDMVGHTGIIPAAIKAVETVDACVGSLAKAVIEMNGNPLSLPTTAMLIRCLTKTASRSQLTQLTLFRLLQ